MHELSVKPSQTNLFLVITKSQALNQTHFSFTCAQRNGLPPAAIYISVYIRNSQVSVPLYALNRRFKSNQLISPPTYLPSADIAVRNLRVHVCRHVKEGREQKSVSAGIYVLLRGADRALLTDVTRSRGDTSWFFVFSRHREKRKPIAPLIQWRPCSDRANRTHEQTLSTP